MITTGLQTLGATLGIYQEGKDNSRTTVAKRALATVGGAAACALLNSRGPLKNRAHWLFFGSMVQDLTHRIKNDRNIVGNVAYGAILAGAFLFRNSPFATKPILIGLVMLVSQTNFVDYSPKSTLKEKFFKFRTPILGLEILGFAALVHKTYTASK